MDSQNINQRTIEWFTQFLEEKNHRKTPERFAILDEILLQKDHFGIEELYLSMRSKNHRVSRATLYNTIDLLLESKLVVKHQFGKNNAQYERSFAIKTHDHLIDIDNGAIIEFEDPRLAEIIEEVCDKHNFDISHHTLYVYGNKKKQE